MTGALRVWRVAAHVARLRLLAPLSQVQSGVITMDSRARRRALLVLGLSSVSGATLAGRVIVAEELTRLAEVHGFEVTGLAHTEDGWGRAEGDRLSQRLRTLLDGYDHIIVSRSAGGVDRVIILGEKAAWTPPPPLGDAPLASEAEADAEGSAAEIVLPMVRRGSQRLVTLTLEGRGGRRIEQELLVDTGADYLVLPSSKVAELGIDRDGLQERRVQTANGKVTARLGRLPGLWLGEARLAGVEVAFIEDESLGRNALLGMSVLGRYRLTIDDEQGELSLYAREAARSDDESGSDDVPDESAGD